MRLRAVVFVSIVPYSSGFAPCLILCALTRRVRSQREHASATLGVTSRARILVQDS